MFAAPSLVTTDAAAGLPGNVCCAVIQLGRGFDVERLRRRIAESPIMDWLARVRIIRPLPLLPPLWRTVAKPKAILFEHTDQNGGADTPWSLPQVVARARIARRARDRDWRLT